MVASNTVAQLCCSLLLLACCVTAANAASNEPPPFSQLLEENNVRAAFRSASTQYPVRAGPGSGVNVSALTNIINTAAEYFGDLDQAKQPVYAEAFGQFIHQLDPSPASNQTTLLAAFANSLASALKGESCFTLTCRTYDLDKSYYIGPVVELTHAAGLDPSFVGAFEQAKQSQQSVQQAEEILSELETHGGDLPRNYTLTPDVLASLRAAAANAFAAKSNPLNQAKGNTAVLASLLFQSAFSYVAEGNSTAAAQNLSATVTSAGLPASVQQQAFNEAIQHALQAAAVSVLPGPSNDTIAVLIAAAVATQQADAIPDSFAEVHLLAHLA
ncbi:hypothetical protein ABBQ38_014105 [Trebouxia sp. C0009 RCD-2024]